MAFTTASAVREKTERTSVGIGEAAMAAQPVQLTTIVGSCIAIALYSPRLHIGMLSHAVLPHSNGETMYPAKFADTAVSHMITVLAEHGATAGGLIAKISGGACMFGDGKFMQIGETNIKAAHEALAAADIRIVGEHVGGNAGRRVSFDLTTGAVTVECFGHPSQTI